MAAIGLYGGSFNPVHLGHLLVAQAAQEELSLDRLFFIPAAQSPFKPGQELAPAAERACLLRLAMAGRPAWSLDEQELRRGGVSYTIDTLRDYARRFPHDSLHYLIGADHVPSLPKWREAAEMARLARFVVVPRPGEPPAALPTGFSSVVLHGFPLGVSASQVRERVRAGLPIDLLTPPAVAEAIRNNRLYL